MIQSDLYRAFFDDPPVFIGLTGPTAQMWTMLVDICISGQRSTVNATLRRIEKSKAAVDAAMKSAYPILR